MALLPRRFTAAGCASNQAEEVAMYPKFAVYLTANEGAHLGFSFPVFNAMVSSGVA